jgi:flagellar biogenesis protein FliO
MQKTKARRDDEGRRAVAGPGLEATALRLAPALAVALVLALTAPVAVGQDAASDGTEGYTQPESGVVYGDLSGFTGGLTGDPMLGQPASRTSTARVIGRFVFAVLLVVSLILLCVMVLRRYGLPRGALGAAGPRLELRAQLHLGPRRTVYLVRVDGTEILLGTSGDGLRLLTELPGSWAVASAGAGLGTSAGAGTGLGGRVFGRTVDSFATTLGSLMNGPTGTLGHEHARR